MITVSARERILSTATRLFYEHGIHRVGIDLVIAESGVAKMSLYRQFGSKEELVLAFLDRINTEWFTWLSPTKFLFKFLVVDPVFWYNHWGWDYTFNNLNGRVYEYACHEGNYALAGILAGARAEEKAGLEMSGNRGQVRDEGE